MTKTNYRTWLAERFTQMYALKTGAWDKDGKPITPEQRDHATNEAFMLADAFMKRAIANGDDAPWEREG